MTKRGSKLVRSEKSREFDSSKFYKDEDVRVFKVLLEQVKRKHHISAKDIPQFIQEEILIPTTIFTKKLSPLETDVKYLKENLDLNYSKIAELLGRNRKTIWQAYKNAAKKLPGYLKPTETEYNLPVSIFRTDLSILEAVVVYLKDKFRLSYHQIGQLLKRDERTVWTVYHRAQIKRKHEA